MTVGGPGFRNANKLKITQPPNRCSSSPSGTLFEPPRPTRKALPTAGLRGSDAVAHLGHAFGSLRAGREVRPGGNRMVPAGSAAVLPKPNQPARKQELTAR